MDEGKYYSLLNSVFYKALNVMSFSTVCTVLRVGGMRDANWDPFEESRDSLDDLNWILKITGEKRSEKCQTRIALLMYCQLIEMTAPHEILMNLLRCIHEENYTINPLGHLGRSKKNVPFSYVPPSAKKKFSYICEKAKEYGEYELAEALYSIFSDDIRNAFSHSDYIITDNYFRYSSGGLPQQIELEKLRNIINSCFEFYSAFINLHRHWLHRLSETKKFHKWPHYEVLELLSDESGLYGFNVHFSNGSKATYTRRKIGTEAINLIIDEDGIGFMQGSIDELEPVWKINGTIVENWDTLE